MHASDAVREGIPDFYRRFSTGDPAAFAAGIADVAGVSVIGSAPGEGHDDRASWIGAYERGMATGLAGTRLEGDDPRGWEEGPLGWGVDGAAFVFPDGSRLPTRLTAVLRCEEGDWKVVHLHFSVGIPDDQAIERP